MKLIVLIFGCFAASKALVCTPELCGMIKAAPLQCKGSIIKGGGFCGCTDACAKQVGESCDLPSGPHFLGMLPSGPCDDGLECISPVTENHSVMRLGKGVCSKPRQRHCFCVTSHNGEVIQSSKVLGSADCSSHSPARRDLTQCQQMYQLRMISFVIYQGMWTPKCDAEGKFEPVQCDNTGKFPLNESNHCFCVTEITGTVVKGSKVPHTKPDCSQYDLTEENITPIPSF
uniref:Thyroglobulin type-1 domain-containing protein n=1 Tax=Magallana gigas TaxID=29159 RepID=K1RFK3_MAGGI